jgi:rhodanese-related sulfurtransferase
MRVRLKKEIITMRLPTMRPEGGRAPAVDAPRCSAGWHQGHDDEGRELLMLDTRNEYETAVGAFDDAVDYRLASFTGFPAAIAADRERYEGKTVVSYCTGGIRCEKAALHMQDLGMPHVYQLDGGILKYLEQTDGAHWHGDCFVFDERGAVDPTISRHRAEIRSLTDLHIDIVGTGPMPLVILHGWAMHGGVMSPLVEALKDRCTMYVVDLPGHGYSRDCGLPLEPSACAAAIAAATPPAIWLGWSMGGLIALTAALEMPQQVRSGDALRHAEIRAR